MSVNRSSLKSGQHRTKPSSDHDTRKGSVITIQSSSREPTRHMSSKYKVNNQLLEQTQAPRDKSIAKERWNILKQVGFLFLFLLILYFLKLSLEVSFVLIRIRETIINKSNFKEKRQEEEVNTKTN